MPAPSQPPPVLLKLQLFRVPQWPPFLSSAAPGTAAAGAAVAKGIASADCCPGVPRWLAVDATPSPVIPSHRPQYKQPRAEAVNNDDDDNDDDEDDEEEDDDEEDDDDPRF